ncbi:MAG: hypothetical protein IPM43_05770 [Actinomycetota bacterium]|nr:MAG: hypothetical protein IPM43_05770 [Actinomycetota bacterium]
MVEVVVDEVVDEALFGVVVTVVGGTVLVPVGSVLSDALSSANWSSNRFCAWDSSMPVPQSW